MNGLLRVYLVDDEFLAIKRLKRLLSAVDSVEVVGSTTSPAGAVKFLSSAHIDILFLDIQMPGLNGFELLAKLARQPMVIFTTAYDNYALKAFEVNSIDYLLKPVEPAGLERAIKKVQRLRETGQDLETRSQLYSIVSKFAGKLSPDAAGSPNRMVTRVGGRILFLDLDKITHFVSEDKLTFAAMSEGKRHIVDQTLAELEQKLNSKGFVRIHRGTLVNLSYVGELYRWFAGGMRIKIKDRARTELTVSRSQVQLLKARLGL